MNGRWPGWHRRRGPIWVLGLLVAYGVFGLWLRSRRPVDAPHPPGEIRGVFHIHTDKSDGRGSLDEVVAAAREAGLQFIVITDHNVMTPADAGYRQGILVVEATEVSARYGHIVALGLPRELSKTEREGDALSAIRALGGQAVLAHPLHRDRPFTRWARTDWLGMEVVSDDTLFHEALRPASYWRLGLALLALPWDSAQSVLYVYHRPAAELATLDAFDRDAHHLLYCAADAHGYPSYVSVFRAFSMHVPVTLTGHADADIPAVLTALTDGSADCVFDAVGPAWGVRLAASPGGLLRLDAPPGGTFRLFHDGSDLGVIMPGTPWPGPLEPGAYRVEGTLHGRPWIFTNPVWVERRS